MKDDNPSFTYVEVDESVMKNRPVIIPCYSEMLLDILGEDEFKKLSKDFPNLAILLSRMIDVFRSASPTVDGCCNELIRKNKVIGG